VMLRVPYSRSFATATATSSRDRDASLTPKLDANRSSARPGEPAGSMRATLGRAVGSRGQAGFSHNPGARLYELGQEGTATCLEIVGVASVATEIIDPSLHTLTDLVIVAGS
jgi:hypothetical protein